MLNYRNYTTISIQSFFRNRLIVIFLSLSLGVNILIWASLLWQVRSFPDLMALHYNIYFGPDLFGPWYQILFLPGLGLLIIAVNFFAGLYFFKKNELLGYLLSGFAFFTQVILLLAAISIVFINF